MISGGTARNVVPEWCTVQAEARSHDERKLAELVQEMLDAFSFAASVSDCTVEIEVREQYRGYRFRPTSLRSHRGRRLSAAWGSSPRRRCAAAEPTPTSSTRAGFPCVVLANGMAEIHTPDEHIAVADIERMVDVTLALVRGARENDAA